MVAVVAGLVMWIVAVADWVIVVLDAAVVARVVFLGFVCTAGVVVVGTAVVFVVRFVVVEDRGETTPMVVFSLPL